MFKKILLSCLSLSLTCTLANAEVNSSKTNKEKSVISTSDKKFDLNSKIEAKDWFSWIEKLSQNKNIDRVTKKKIYSGAELIAANISKKRSHVVSQKQDEIDDVSCYTDGWKLKEQEITMKMIGEKLSSMTLGEIVEIYNKYGKKDKEVKKK